LKRLSKHEKLSHVKKIANVDLTFKKVSGASTNEVVFVHWVRNVLNLTCY